MTTTYDTALSTDKDRVRFVLGDTASPWMLSDEEISATVTRYGSVTEGARNCCIAILGRLSRTGSSVSLGPFSTSKSDLVRHYQDLLTTLEVEGAKYGSVMPYLGGLVASERTEDSITGSYTESRFTTDGMQT